MRPDVDISKMPVHKARHLEAVDFKKKSVCGLLLLGMGFGEEKKYSYKGMFFCCFSQEHMTLLYRSVIIKNKSFIYKYIYS